MIILPSLNGYYMIVLTDRVMVIDSHTQNIRRHSDKLSDLETRLRVCCCHMYIKICDDYQSIPRIHLSQSIQLI